MKYFFIFLLIMLIIFVNLVQSKGTKIIKEYNYQPISHKTKDFNFWVRLDRAEHLITNNYFKLKNPYILNIFIYTKNQKKVNIHITSMNIVDAITHEKTLLNNPAIRYIPNKKKFINDIYITLPNVIIKNHNNQIIEFSFTLDNKEKNYDVFFNLKKEYKETIIKPWDFLLYAT